MMVNQTKIKLGAMQIIMHAPKINSSGVGRQFLALVSDASKGVRHLAQQLKYDDCKANPQIRP